MRALGYECVQFVASEKATHVVLRRQGHNDSLTTGCGGQRCRATAEPEGGWVDRVIAQSC